MPQADAIIGDRKQDVLLTAKSILQQVTETLARTRDRSINATELSLRLNEQAIALSEKWMLLDGATIGLSLAFIGSLVSRVGHVPRLPFEWLVCPAWFLLLISMYCCWIRMTSIHNLNLGIFRVMDADAERISLQQLAISVGCLTVEINSVFAHQDNKDIEKPLQQLANTAKQVTEAITEAERAAAAARQGVMDREGVSIPFERIAKLTTGVALILLCVFAVKVILSL
ncbi:MAG TPA: hypothetical protein VMD98_02600 [Bryocella sp.]|nr:hypothetical protein [Bryocella sp.]